MAETQADYLTIGEVLGMLVEEFPEVTISKIRFLESQGLIAPERTSSGYRRFHDTDVELLRVILTEQRENYLPLRVIRDRIASGEIDPSGEMSRPHGVERPSVVPASPLPAESRPLSVTQHPSGTGAASTARRPSMPERGPQHGDAQLLPGVILGRDEFRSMTGLTETELSDLESFGIVRSRHSSGPSTYGEHEVIIARSARTLIRSGIDARHLRAWRTAAEREASLIEQVIAPHLRHGDATQRAKLASKARELSEAGARLRAAFVDTALRDLL